jgi:hypothetical protein
LNLPFVAPILAQVLAVQPAQTEPPQAKAAEQFQVFGQVTMIPVHDLSFRSPYSGQNSLRPNNQVATSQTFTLFIGQRITRNLELYLNPEDTRGIGLGSGFGLAGAPNTEVIHASKSKYPYWARAFLRWTFATHSRDERETVDAAENQLAGPRPKDRIVLTLGRMSAADTFDTNAYANSPRTQFMNLDLVNSAAYDYAADVRGYTIGVVGEFDGPGYALRAGVLQMPEVANGETLDGNITKANGKQVEFEFHPTLSRKLSPGTFRILGYLNHARMGSYTEAIQLGQAASAAPNVAATDAPGRFKYGLNLNLEQPLADQGDTGLFGRLALNDGKTESYVYSEAEASFATGIQISGKKLRAPGDMAGLAFAINGLGKDHRAYLEAGGYGFQIGDGKLSYGTEQLAECYYNHRLAKGLTLGADLQLIQNPGYNRDRGPVPIVAIRLHAEF